MHPIQARLFIAIPVPNPYRSILSAWAEVIKEKWNFKRWLHPADYHITLKFLGECDFTTANQVKKHLKEISGRQHSFTLRIEGLGTFDNRENTKILWAGVDGDLIRLHQLQQEVDQAMETLHFEPEKQRYRPHVTLARNYVNGILTAHELEKAPTLKENLISWEAKEIVLYQTHLGQSPSYQPIAIYPFPDRRP